MKRVSVRLRALREEFSEAPLEIGGFVEDADLRKVNTSLAQKTKFEEDNMRRLNLSKADKKKVRTLRAGRKDVTGAASLAEVGDFSELAADLDGERGGRRKSALAEYRNASKQAQEVRSMKSAEYSVDFRDPSKGKKREKTASSHRVSAAEIEGGEFAAKGRAKDERKLARKADWAANKSFELKV